MIHGLLNTDSSSFKIRIVGAHDWPNLVLAIDQDHNAFILQLHVESDKSPIRILYGCREAEKSRSTELLFIIFIAYPNNK